MNSKKLCRSAALLLLLAVFFGVLVWSVQPPEALPEKHCLGVEILSEEDMAQFQEYRYRDYSEELRYQGEFAPVDQENSVIYLAQKLDGVTNAKELPGRLTLDFPGAQLYFAPDENWDSLAQAVKSGHTFKLLVFSSQKTYMQYDVVFTTLPVLTLHGELLYKDEEMRNVFSGQLRLWDPAEESGEGEGLLSSRVHWHVRGKSAGGQEKKPWKLSLKNRDGENNSGNLLGLGSDDDWILNAMNMEDSNIREKLFMDLWNELSEQEAHNYPMSRGEYAEVLVNGEYSGLYLLQRRIDGQYLEMDRNSVLIKSNWDGSREGYEIVYPNVAGAEQISKADALIYEDDIRLLSVPNFVDVNLFLQLFCAGDNQHSKNMYFAYSAKDGKEEVALIPWDTDMAFGIKWDSESERFVYRYEECLYFDMKRQETDSMAVLHPELNRITAERWQELRQSVFRQEHIEEKIGSYFAYLDASGAVNRDQEKWGLYFDGEDTLENLYRFVDERLQILDRYYSE